MRTQLWASGLRMESKIFSDQEYQEILNHLNELMEDADTLPYPNAKELIFTILKYFDSIHREPLSRMMSLLDQDHPEIRQQLQQDFAMKTLLGLYDLLQEKKLDTPKILGFVPLEQVTLMNPQEKKEWLELGYIQDFEEKKLYPRNFEKVNFLISKIDKEVFAIQNRCVDSILPIDQGRVEEHFLICPWHGCRYDLRTGQAVNQAGKKLDIFPVEIETDGLLKVEISY